MTYKLALSIRNMVKNLDETRGGDNFKCAIGNPSEVGNRWEVYLFNTNARFDYESELWAIALGIQRASVGLIVNKSTYDAGTKRGHFVECIKIF